MKRILLPILLLPFVLLAQPRVISGPMLAGVELRDARVWTEVSSDAKSVSVRYGQSGKELTGVVSYVGQLGKTFNPITITLGSLEPNTTYDYIIYVNGKKTDRGGSFTTKELWQWRKPAPDFSFLTGSCSYFNEPPYDRPGRSYGQDSSIFEPMAKEKSAFMLWLGDAWYTREVDYYSEWGLWNRASRDRSLGVLQPFWKAMPHYGIWDDHDYGPNNSGKSYELKEASRQVFTSYFPNPSAGQNGQGIYTKLSYADADFFLTDDRWWRSEDRVRDSVNGQPNPDKRMLGSQQMEWLKEAILASNAVFKFVVMGSQVLNDVSLYDKWTDFPAERQEFLDFIRAYKINGVVFITGDRHHSEVIKMNRPGTYPLYDVTVSPLTSGTHKFDGPEANNPLRVFGLDQKNNYGRISISGLKGARKLTVDFLGTKGEKLGVWEVNETDLKTPR
ncbi:MAG: alkaline phosphatase D family protein [Bacteroidota bacterium]